MWRALRERDKEGLEVLQEESTDKKEPSDETLGCFSSVGSSYKPSHPYLPVSVGSLHIQEYLKKKRGRKLKFIKPQQEKVRHEERMKRGKVIFR